jgi:alkaline phosphatase D
MLRQLLIVALFIPLVATAQNNPNEPTRSGAIECLAPFFHGVASGDPLQDRVILWTRVTTDSANAVVNWRIASDTAITNIINSGTVTTDDTKDFTVKVDATGLQPFTWYYYEFETEGKRSVRGRTRTLPVGDVDSLRFAIVSCADYTNGYYNAYAKITERNDIFAVIHLGDYIYEYGGGTAPRNHEPGYEILTVGDYRIRHSHYKLDEDLMRLHQQYPFFAVWDDHETANNAWFGGAENHTPGTEGNWFDRKAAGVQAYYEWMPLRMPDPVDTMRIYRKFNMGDLIDLYMMDTRLQGREEQNGHDTNPARTLLGAQQRQWFLNETDSSTARWQIMGQQVMFAPLRVQIGPFPAFYPNDDQWDGYPAERTTIQNHFLNNNIPNFVVLTGDIHTSWANDIPGTGYNASTGAGSVGVEFVATSVTSQGSPLPVGQGIIQSVNPHMKFIDLSNHGYVLLDVNKDRTQGEFWFVNTIDTRGGTNAYTQGWFVNNNERHLRQAAAASVANPNMIGVPAPTWPIGYNPNCNTTTSVPVAASRETVLLGVYPNPFNSEIMLQLTLNEEAETAAIVYDAMGREVARKDFGKLNAGMQELPFDLEKHSAGNYYIIVKMGNKTNQRKLIKTK